MPRAAKTPSTHPVLLDAARKTWRADGPHFLGHILHHVVLDPRDGRTLLAAKKTGHLGPTIFRSTNLGKTWPGINDNMEYRPWMGAEQDGTPDGPKLHSLIVDPRDANTAWAFPMDGATVWPRTSPGGAPAAYVTRDAGKKWQRRGVDEPRRGQALHVHRPAPARCLLARDCRDPLTMKVLIPTPLTSYTKVRHVNANGATLADVLLDLDRQFPGIVRPHVRIFINGEQSFDLRHPLREADDIQIVQALSGG